MANIGQSAIDEANRRAGRGYYATLPDGSTIPMGKGEVAEAVRFATRQKSATARLIEAVNKLPATDGRVIGLLPLAEQAAKEQERAAWIEAELDRVRKRAEIMQAALDDINDGTACETNHPRECCNCESARAGKALRALESL